MQIKVRGSNPTLTLREFLWAQDINLWGSTRPICELVKKGRCLRNFYIPGCRMLAAHETGSEVISPRKPERSSNDQGKLMSDGG